MNIAVCLKQVPKTGDLQLAPETNTLIREGAEAVLNPLDAFPLEAGLRLREKLGGTVTAFTMGPPMAERILEQAVALGADDGVLLCDQAFAGADTWATSLTLARGLERRGPFDLVLCGKQAVDGDTAQVGPGIAAHLGLPQVTYVTRIEAIEKEQGCLRLVRMLDCGEAEVEVDCPAVLTVLKQANEPRFPSLVGRLKAYNKQFPVLTASDLGLSPAEVGLEGSPTRVKQVTVPENRRGQVRVAGTPEDCAQALIEGIGL